MARKVAELFGVLSLDDGDFIKGLGFAKSGILELDDDLQGLGGGLISAMKTVGAKITEIGGQMTVLGGAIQTITGPLVGFGEQAVGAAVDFDESMKNIQAAAGYTTDEMKGISEQVLEIGAASRYGPNQAAQAFYDIAGGVSDASARMGTFEAVIAAAQAGNADLGSTTKAMISIMNDYKFSADQAGFASDVLTRMVGTGVGSMNDFASAIPNAASAAAGLGISFDDVGAQMAFLTTKGFTASQSATKLVGMMSALVSPSKEVSSAIEEAGYTSGRAMIAANGLAGAYEILAKNNGGTLDGLIKDQEALSGATALATADFQKFDDTFKNSAVVTSDGPKMLVDNMDLVNTGIQGATDAAQDIQMTSAASQIDLLNSSIENLKIAVGTDLMPMLVDLTNNTLKPLVQGVMDWVNANPQAAMTIMMLVGATALLGVALTVAGTALSAIGTAITVLSGPIGLAIAAVLLLGLAYTQNLGGIRDFVVNEIQPRIEEFFNFLRDIWAQIQPSVQKFADWWTVTALPAIKTALDDIWHNYFEKFFAFLGKAWEVAGPPLMSLLGWFIAYGLPLIGGAIGLVYNTFIKPFFDFFGTVWDIARNGLTHLANWFNGSEGLQGVVSIIKDASDAATKLINGLKGIWDIVGPGVQAFANGIKTTLGPVVTFIQGIAASVQDLISKLGGVVDTVTGNTGGDSFGKSGGTSLGDLKSQMGKAAGGPVMGGVPVTVGEQGREIFVPSSSGTIIPNNQLGEMGGISVSIGAIYANDAAGGRAAAESFDGRLRELQASRGGR